MNLAEQVKLFAQKLHEMAVTDETIIDPTFAKFMNQEDPRIIALINHSFFATQFKLTNYLKRALEGNPRASEPIRKKVLTFISTYVETHSSYMVEHIKGLFGQLLSHFYKEQGKVKELTLMPLITILEVYEPDHLVNEEVVNPVKLHSDITTILQQAQKKVHGVIGECWHLLATIQNRFPTLISPIQKRKVQQNCFIQLKGYVKKDTNYSTIAALLRALSKSLRENYLSQEQMAELYNYVFTLTMPLKATYVVPLAALEVLQTRMDLFKDYIMANPQKLFDSLRNYTGHKNRDFSLKSLEVLIIFVQVLINVIQNNTSKYRKFFIHIRDRINTDLSNHVTKNKGQTIPQEQKGFNLLTVVRLIGMMAPLYLEYQGKVSYRKIFNYIIKKCTKKIILENTYQPLSKDNFQQIKYILYSQKELKSFIAALAQLIEQLEEIDYDSASQLEMIFTQAVKESKYFLLKYQNQLWEAMVQLIMSIQIKGSIFSKWAKKVISQSLKQCLDSNKLNIESDSEYIKMIEKAAHLWKSILSHPSWRTGALNQFSQLLMANYQYLVLNLDCGYRIKNEDQGQDIMSQEGGQEEGIVNIFFMPNERIEISKIEDYQYMSSLSLLFNEILLNIDESLYSQRIFNFYPLLLERIRTYPKSLPLLRALRTLNEFILKTDFFKRFMSTHKEYCSQLLQKMRRFFSEGIVVVFKYQEQYFYQLLKILLSFSVQVYFMDGYRIIKSQLAQLIVRTLEMGQQIISLAFVAVRCLKKVFTAEKKLAQLYLSPAIPALEKYINVDSNSQKQQMKSHLFLYEQNNLTKQGVSEEVLSFLGALGGSCHLIVDNKNHDHIAWDFDCHLTVEVNILNDNYSLNLTRILSRACWLAINGGDEVKIVGCEFIHAVITYVIEEVFETRIKKDTLAVFLDKVLPIVLTIAGNTSHPSQQLIHTLLIQLIHFFANTKEPNSPDIQVILKHLLSLYNKSQDMGFLASKCLSEFVRWNVKQQVLKDGNVPILKALMSNIWSLVGNWKARDGIITFLVKLLKIIHREKEIMNYYCLELGFLLIALTRYNAKLEPEFLYLIEKYCAILKKYMKLLVIQTEGRRYKKAKTIKEFLQWLYLFGFFSIYRQQREVSYFIWHTVIQNNSEMLGFSHVEFLKSRANKDLKYLFGSTTPLIFNDVEENVVDKFCWKVVALGEVWLKMAEFSIFNEDNLVRFIDIQNVYLVSLASFLEFVLDPKNQENVVWSDQIQQSIISNLTTFMRILHKFNAYNSRNLLRKLLAIIAKQNITEVTLHKVLFNAVYQPDKIIKKFNKQFLGGEQLNQYILLFVHVEALARESALDEVSAIQIVFQIVERELGLKVNNLLGYVCLDESAQERKIKLILGMLKAGYEHELAKNSNGYSAVLEEMMSVMMQYLVDGRLRTERTAQVITFVLNFRYGKVTRFVLKMMSSMSPLYQRFQKLFLRYIDTHWEQLRQEVVQICLKSIDHIKILYILLKRLKWQQISYFMEVLPKCQVKEQFRRDLLKINFILVQGCQQRLPEHYLQYMQKMVEEGLQIDRPFQVHEQSLYLCGLLLQKKVNLEGLQLKHLKIMLNTLQNKYCPFVISRLDTPEKQQQAVRYFEVIRNLIVISEEFVFIEQFFIELKDPQLKGYYATKIDQLLQDSIRSCFTLDDQRPMNWSRWLLSFYQDVNIDKDEWTNFRLAVVDKMLRKAIVYIKPETVLELYNSYIDGLDSHLRSPLVTDGVKMFLVDLQVRKASLLLVELLYGNLPHKPANELHKNFIKYCTSIVKTTIPPTAKILITDHDKASTDPDRKATKIYREYACYAYNCMLILFVTTQSNKEHFRSFLFEDNKTALWNNLVDVQQVDFGFQVETQFKIMKPYTPINNKLKEVRAKIERQYFESSLYVVEQEIIPQTQLAAIKEENEDEGRENGQQNTGDNAGKDAVPKIEEDIINRHPCMVNMLRVVDFLNKTFPDPMPTWMGAISNYLSKDTISLAERILLLKLILNRPAIFNQPMLWVPHLLNYLSLPNTGSKYIHYFYRDALKRYLQLLPNYLEHQRPNQEQLNKVIMRVVTLLPHDNTEVYIDNVNLLEDLFKVPGVYVDRKTLAKMLKSEDMEESKKNQWRLCAIIVIKLCLANRIPILLAEQHIQLSARPSLRYQFYYTHIKQYFKAIFEAASQSGKKYRIAANGLLGQFLSFIFNSADLSDPEKKEHYDMVAKFLHGIAEKKANRATKERFSLALQKIVSRFPHILTDQKVFGAFQDGVVHYSGSERCQLLIAFKEYARSLLSINDTSKIANFFMLLRVNWEKISVDSQQVQLALLEVLNLCTDGRILSDKDVLKSYSIIINNFNRFVHDRQLLAMEYFKILTNLKNYLSDQELPKEGFYKDFHKQVEKQMVAALTCKYEAPFNLIFGQFQKDVNLNLQRDMSVIFRKICLQLFSDQHEYLWINNVTPLLLTLCKNSSDYKRLFSSKKLEQNMQQYDWDFRNFRINDASLPYTPFSIIRKDNELGASMQNRQGMIRATQFSMSQGQQIFTQLESISPSVEASQQSELTSQQLEKAAEEENKYGKINDLFKNRRKRNRLMDDFKADTLNKTSAAVKYVEDKIRFTKTGKVKPRSEIMKKFSGKEKLKKGAILRAYKLGELPNIQVSQQNLIEPLIFLSLKDFQLSSQVFLQLLETACSLRRQNCDILNTTLTDLLQSSRKHEFNFISTLQKGLIKMCQKFKKFLPLSMKEIAIESNTLDYAVLFTEENLIQGEQSSASQVSHAAIQAHTDNMMEQWTDLADYYQLLNEPDLVESVILQLLGGQKQANIIKALKEKREGDLNNAKRLFDDFLMTDADSRLSEFIKRERIDTSALLAEWDDVCRESMAKREDGVAQSSQELKMYVLALENLDTCRRDDYLHKDRLLTISGSKYEYQRGMLCVMREGGMDGAKFHALNSRQMFRKQWQRVSSFAFNSKHEILQTLQKNYELMQFVNLYRDPKAYQQSAKKLFSQWTSRTPSTIFDDNLTWVQILSSRLLFGRMIGEQHGVSGEQMAKSLTEWHVQVVNGMLAKGVLGYAQNMIRKALHQHKLTKQFDWQFYESISRLKLLQLQKKGSLKIEEYSIVPKLIQKEMDLYSIRAQLDRHRLTMIKNQYYQGYMDVSLQRRADLDKSTFILKAIETFNNYEQIKRGIRSIESVGEQFRREVHFEYAIFLENLLSTIRGKFEIKQIKDVLERKEYGVKLVATKFIEQLVYSIKLLQVGQVRTGQVGQEASQQVFQMILKLIKILQSDHQIVGNAFQDVILDRDIPKWVFIYFIPQMIRNINNYDLALHLRQLFQYLLFNYPEALVYPFNCTYPRITDCHTDLARHLFRHLHQKMGKYFQFVQNLFLVQHPQLRLKDILTKYLNHGEHDNAIAELQDFTKNQPYLGKYNLRFNENYKNKIENILDMRKRGLNRDVTEQIRKVVATLDPSKCNMMRYFTKLGDGSLWFEEYNMSDWVKLEVPGTIYNKFEQPLPWNKVLIESFDSNILTLQSIRRPKRISVLGSNQKTYLLLVKGGQDVRLDQRVEQLFELVNRILLQHPQTNKKQLKISRFQVIPMKPMFGVFQWVDKSQTLRSFLQTELRMLKNNPELNLADKNQGFSTFIKFFTKISPGANDKYSWHKNLMMQSDDVVRRNMQNCQKALPYGLLRGALQKLAKNYDSFLHIKNQYISNYSAICLITYLFGIGDRHLQNFLIQTSTGSMVMIDFGYSFGASVELPIPEIIPFRLTKSFIDLTQPIGLTGLYRKCMLACFEALRKKMQLIVDYCDVFVDDPLMEWVWVSRKQLAGSSNAPPSNSVVISGTNHSFSVSQQAPERKLFSNKIKIVQNKLRGHNPRYILESLLLESKHKTAPFLQQLRKAIKGGMKNKGDILLSEEVVDELVMLAGDKNVTGRSYIGLNLFV